MYVPANANALCPPLPSALCVLLLLQPSNAGSNRSPMGDMLRWRGSDADAATSKLLLLLLQLGRLIVANPVISLTHDTCGGGDGVPMAFTPLLPSLLPAAAAAAAAAELSDPGAAAAVDPDPAAAAALLLRDLARPLLAAAAAAVPEPWTGCF